MSFDPAVEVSPYTLFRRLREGDPPRLVDLRPRAAVTLRGAVAVAGWVPEAGEEAVLFDDDGGGALERARALQAAGFSRVRALFGGLRLYDFALDPAVVGGERFLSARRNVSRRRSTRGRSPGSSAP